FLVFHTISPLSSALQGASQRGQASLDGAAVLARGTPPRHPPGDTAHAGSRCQDSVRPRPMSVIRKNATTLTRHHTLTGVPLIPKNATGIFNTATGCIFHTISCDGMAPRMDRHACAQGPQELPQPHWPGAQHPHVVDDRVRVRTGT